MFTTERSITEHKPALKYAFNFFFSHELNSKHTVIYILFYTSSFNTDKVKLNYTKSKENYKVILIFMHITPQPLP